jgi:glycosyltransferase involved in cell wall biosynthesis
MTPAHSKPAIVVIATSWGRKYGGINSLSTDLCVALTAVLAEHRVVCISTAPVDQALAEISGSGVDILSLNIPHDGPADPSWADKLIALLDARGIGEVSYWLGHDAITGALALACADQAGQGRSVILMHMSYADYMFARSAASEGSAIAERSNRQKSMLQRAHHGCAIGPLLFDRLKEIRGESSSTSMLVPGLPDGVIARPPTDRLHVISVGRFSSADALVKQAPLTVVAFARAFRIGVDQRNAVLSNAQLTLIGVPADEADQLRVAAEKEAGRVPPIQTLDYELDRDRLLASISEANISLMLSWHEGFGLAGWEAIGAGVPLVVSRNSGLYRLLESIGGAATGCVCHLDIRGRSDGEPLDADVDNVAQALLELANRLPRTLSDARSLRSLLRDRGYSWEAAVESLAHALGLPVIQPLIDTYAIDAHASEPAAVAEGLNTARAQQSLVFARSLYDQGQYEDVLQLLESLSASVAALTDSDIRRDAVLLEADTRLRLNEYERALQLARRAAREALDRADWGRYVRARSVENVVCRDRGFYEEAVQIATDLLKVAREHKLSVEEESAERKLARSLALAGRWDIALDHARQALQMATQRLDESGQAKATLALAEAHRLGLNQSEAAEAYANSRDLAGRAGDVDCYLWAALGLADSLFLLGRDAVAEETLNRLASYLDAENHRHPLERLHLRLSKYALKLRAAASDLGDPKELIQEYEALGIVWPKEYLAQLGSGDFSHPKRF